MLSKKIDQILQPLYKRRPALVLLKVLSVLVSIIPPLLTPRLIYDLGEAGGESTFQYIAIIAGVLVVLFFLDWLQDYFWLRMENEGIGLVSSFLFSNAIRKSYFYLKNRSVGDIENKVMNDASIYANSKLSSKPLLFVNIMHISVILIILFLRDVPMTFTILGFSVAFYLIYRLINKHLRETALKERESRSEVLTDCNEILSGAPTIQLYGEEEYFAHRFEKSIGKYEHLLLRWQKFRGLSQAATSKVIGLLPLVAIAVGFLLYSVGIDVVGVSGILTFYLLIPYLAEPIKALTQYNVDAQNAKIVESRLEDLLMKESVRNGRLVQIDEINNFEFINICYKYNEGVEVLWNVNFDVKPGDALAVVGPSGAGKSTFLRLLKRQIHPSWGKIMINGYPHHDVDEKSYIKRIVSLSQEVFVFDDTVRENIKFGKEVSDERLAELMQLCALDHISLDKNAKDLSMGETQRMGLARALSCDYDILIMDEPTSELDLETETKIIQNLRSIQEKNGCIFIVVTHSENVLKNLCNKELRLEKVDVKAKSELKVSPYDDSTQQ